MVVLVVGVEDNYITKISREKTMVVIHFTKTWGNRLLLRVPWGDWSNSMRMKFPWVAPLWWSVKGVPMESGTKGSPQFHQNASDKTLNVPLQTPPPSAANIDFMANCFSLIQQTGVAANVPALAALIQCVSATTLWSV